MDKDKQSYYKHNRLKQMRAFCEVVRTGSITQAAQNLFLSQPSVTLQIQALEREFGVTVFERRGPALKLTPDGETLYELADPLVKGMDSMEESFAALHGRLESGELNIGAGESTILYVLPETVRRFVATYPRIQTKLHNVTGRDGLKMLRADEVDLVVGSMLEVPDDIIYEPVAMFDPVLIVPLDHPLAAKSEVTLEEISHYGLILPPRHLSTWNIVKYVFQQHHLTFTVALEAGGWEVIKKYVELGMGISIVTDICLTGSEKLVRIPLRQYFPQRGYGLVLRKGKFLSPQARRFVEILHEVYGTQAVSNGSGKSTSSKS